MRKVNVMFSLLLLVAMSAAAAEKRVHKTVPIAANGSVSIDTHNGTVTVTTWNQPSVDVSARIEPGENAGDDEVRLTEIRVTGSGENVRIESDYSEVPTRFVFLGVSRDLPLVHYTISMPASARLTVEAHNSAVRVSGLRNDVRINTHNGNVDLAGIDGGASIETHNGNVHVAFSRLVSVSSIETHNGGIDLSLPAQSRFRINASGHHLGLNSDFPATVRSMDRSRYIGEVNGGGPELRITTHNGSLKLRKT
jgi:DUF4097 and DUF4098 domain-containing protein YvlB